MFQHQMEGAQEILAKGTIDVSRMGKVGSFFLQSLFHLFKGWAQFRSGWEA